MSAYADIRKFLGRELAGREIAFTAAASGHTTSAVVDLDAAYFTQSGDFAQNDMLFMPGAAAADKLRMITSFTVATGTWAITPVYSASTVPNAAPYEIWKYLDPLNTVPLLVNKALERIPVMATFNFAPVADSYEQDLTTNQSWLTNRAWPRQVAYLGTNGDQQQTITQSGSPGGGTFTLTYRGNATSALAYDASAATIQTAVRLLNDLGSVTVTRTGTTTNFVWVITMTGTDQYQPIMTANAASLTGGSSPAITPSITRNRGHLRSLSGNAVKRDGTVYLQTGRTFATTERLYVSCIKPAYYHCRASSTGVFGAQSGLSGEAHEAVPDEDVIAFAALTILARRELSTISQASQSAIAVQGPRWAATFKKLMRERWSTARDADLDLEPISFFGPGSGYSRSRGTAGYI